MAISLLLLAGCASIVNGRHQTIPVKSEPSGAILYMNGVEMGKTPTSIVVNRKKPPELTFQHIGYYPQTIKLRRRPSAWLLLDPIFPIPYLGILGIPIDFINGAAWTVTPSGVNVYLSAQQTTIKPVVATQVSVKPITQQVEVKPPPKNFPQVQVAVVDLDALGLSSSEVLTLTENLRGTLVDTGYFQIVSRYDMDRILKEGQFQRTGACSESQCLVEMGRILAVQKIIGGTIGKVGQTYNISLRIVDVETAKIEQSIMDDFRGEPDQLLPSIRMVGKKLAVKFAESRTSKPVL